MRASILILIILGIIGLAGAIYFWVVPRIPQSVWNWLGFLAVMACCGFGLYYLKQKLTQPGKWNP